MIFIESRDFKKKVKPSGKTLEEVLCASGINADNFIAMRNGKLITRDEKIRDGDSIKLFPVISGG